VGCGVLALYACGRPVVLSGSRAGADGANSIAVLQ